VQIKNFTFQELPFSPLFQTYTSNFGALTDFYQTSPFDKEAVAAAAGSPGVDDRAAKVQALRDFNTSLGLGGQALQNIDQLDQPDALAIVTGQQLGLYGGPVFTMYKALTAIHLARQWQERLQCPVVPVFWLADEDHDYEEIQAVQVLNGEGVDSFSLPSSQKIYPPVSELDLPQKIGDLQQRLQKSLIDTDFSDNLWELLNSCYQPGVTFGQSFAQLLSQIFAKHGLVLAGSNHPAIKKQTGKVLTEAVKKQKSIRQALAMQSQKLGQLFHQQVTLYDSHLFYLDTEEGRIKINHKNGQWQTDTGKNWTTDELVAAIDDAPELFSPDVFLRPVLQDHLLPTLGYVGGPGEIAYYGQMKTFYSCFGKTMPVIFPRLSATFVEPAINRIFHELPFALPDYNQRIEDLESAYVKQAEQVDIEELFAQWKQQIQQVSVSTIRSIATVDETLEGAAKKTQAHYFNELNVLKGKTYRAAKQHKSIQINRIHRIHRHFFPQRNLQERELSGICYANKFGLDIWDCLLKSLDEAEHFDQHKLIYL